DGPHGAQRLLRHLAPSPVLQVHDQIDGVDAVEIQVLLQQGRRRDLFGRQPERLGQQLADALEDLVARHWPRSRRAFSSAMNAASVRTDRKISRLRSSSDLIWTLYR